MPLSVPPGSSTAKTLPISTSIKDVSPAFQGASRAFTANAAAPADASNGVNGALAAASFAGSGSRGQIQPYGSDGTFQLSRHNTGSSLRSRDPSPSHVAANLAALQALRRPSRTGDPSLAHHQQKWRGPSPLQHLPTGTSGVVGKDEDISSPPTRSLVQLYESKQNLPLQKTQSVRYVSKPGPPIRSPKPVRPLARSISSTNSISGRAQAPIVPTKSDNLRSEASSVLHSGPVSSTKPIIPSFQRTLAIQEAQAPQHRSFAAQHRERLQRTRAEDNDMTDLKPIPARRSTGSPAKMGQHTQDSPENAPKMEKAMANVYPKSHPSSSSESKGPSPLAGRPAMQSTTTPDKTPSPQPMPIRQISREHTRQVSAHMSVDSLANAMVASSLASTRVPSPTKSVFPPLPPPPRRHHFFHQHRHSSQELLITRTPSPAKPMLRQTMRRPIESDDEANDGYQRAGKKHLVRKHQHKHHEGDRKRYRTQVTERERKRYEGVWAANRGLLISSADSTTTTTISPPTDTSVLNIIVADLWRRSHLPDDVLAEVWELVTGSQGDIDRLGREEFVVGLWLIDQRLKGNKLPVKVSESVWASVRRLPGINVPRNRR